jgi:hypothetical protein
MMCEIAERGVSEMLTDELDREEHARDEGTSDVELVALAKLAAETDEGELCDKVSFEREATGAVTAATF